MQSVRIAFNEKLLGVNILGKCRLFCRCQNSAVLASFAQTLGHVYRNALQSFHSRIGPSQEHELLH